MAQSQFQSWFVDFDPVRAKLDGRTLATLRNTLLPKLLSVASLESKLGAV